MLQYDAVNSFAWTRLGTFYLSQSKREDAQTLQYAKKTKELIGIANKMIEDERKIEE